ncbi:hypothetical protein [Pedococcus soli]
MKGNQQEYMNAAAQIIPVLVLALLADRRRDPARTYVVLIALLAGVVGEVTALYAIGMGTNGRANFVVSVAMAFLGAAILMPHLPTYAKNALYSIPPLWRFIIARAFEVYVLIPGLVITTWGLKSRMHIFTVLGVIYFTFSGWRSVKERRQWLKDNPQQVRFNVYTEADLDAVDVIDRDLARANLGLSREQESAMIESFRERRERKRLRKERRQLKKQPKSPDND